MTDPTGMEVEYDDDGWIINERTGEARYSPHYDETNIPSGWYNGDSIIGEKTIFNADRTHESIDGGRNDCVLCHHDFTFEEVEDKN